jgi:hypothetical protein
MSALLERMQRWRQWQYAFDLESACAVVLLAATFALLALLPYDDIVRSAACLRFYDGHGCLH